LYKNFKKIKLLRFIIHRLLHNQVKGNVQLFDGFLGLNLHPLFFGRFKSHFLIYIRSYIKNIKKKFNFNTFNLKFIDELSSRLLKFGNLILHFSSFKNVNRFFNLLYLNVAENFSNLLTLNFDYKYLNKFRKFMSNLCYQNYVQVSFKLRAVKFK